MRYTAMRSWPSQKIFRNILFCLLPTTYICPPLPSSPPSDIVAASQMSPLLQVLQHVCDSLDSHFASSTVAPASFAKLLKSNACVARHYALSNRLCQLANPSPLDHCRGRSSAAATAAHVTLLHSAAATSLAFVDAHVGRCLAVLCSVMALKWACRYSSPSMKVSSSPLNLSRTL